MTTLTSVGHPGEAMGFGRGIGRILQFASRLGSLISPLDGRVGRVPAPTVAP